MLEKSPKLIWGIVSLLIYGLLIGLLLFYFNTHHDEKPKHYVKKNEHRIQVSLSSPPKKKEKSVRPKIKPKPKPKSQPHKVKPKPKIKETKKKIIKEKVVKKLAKKKVDHNSTKKPKKKKVVKKPIKTKVKKTKVKKDIKPKKAKSVKKTADLFSSIATNKQHKVEKKVLPKPTTRKKTQSALDKIRQSTNTTKNQESGIENAYFAKVQSLLETWPAQSDFAGEKAVVYIYVKQTGQFTFKVKSKSNNLDFNLGLIDFLEQLKRLGLGSHHGGKTYEIKVEFTAKE